MLKTIQKRKGRMPHGSTTSNFRSGKHGWKKKFAGLSCRLAEVGSEHGCSGMGA